MRKKYLFIISVMLLLATAFVLSACSGGGDATEKTVSRLEAVSVHEGDYVIGDEIDLSEITIKTIYSDGSEKSVPAKDSMLTGEEREKFSQEGVHTVKFSYEGYEALLQITVVSVKEGKTYLATFFSNGGSEVPNQNANVIKAFVNPVKANYKFDGWYTAPDFTGSRAVAPYTLTQDTYFYAKWIDNRTCNVKFMDGDEVFYEIEKVVYGSSVNIKSIPAPSAKAGKIFTGWTLISGSNPEEIITDTVFAASYESVKCAVNIEYVSDGKVVSKTFTYNYGEYFDVTNYEMPTLEGHTSRWVLYRGDSEKFEEMTSSRVLLTDEKITVKAEHVINKYSVRIFNGKTENLQTKANLKNGVVELEQVYYNAAEKSDFKVDYGADFNLSEYKQEPNFTSPEAIRGYNAVWCFVVPASDGGEIWYNARNQRWDESSGSFVDNGEATSNFTLYDKNGNYIARVSNGDLKEIKGDVTVKPKYLKNTYTVTLRRYTDKGWTTIGTFTKEYLSDFRLYDPAEYDEGKFADEKAAEFYYHKNNVPAWSADSDVSDMWKQIYFNGNSEDDYDVKWYTSSDRNDESKVDFTRGDDGNLGSYEIQDSNLILYCSDIDLRRYTVTIRYNYDFATGTYKNTETYSEISENQEITLPENYALPVTRDYGSGRTVQYTFNGWSDYPYTPDGNYTGVSGDNFITHRTNNVYYYAQYVCNTTYTLTVYDKTQKEAYAGIEGYDGKHYDVPEHSIVYTVPAGTTVTLDMIFKGKDNGDGTFVTGQTYYERYAFIRYFDNEYTKLHDDIIAKYSSAKDKAEAKRNLEQIINADKVKAAAYETLLAKIYNYDFKLSGSETETVIDKDYFLATFMTAGEYQALRQKIKDAEDELTVLENYDYNKTLRDNYHAEDENEKDENGYGGLYKKYSESDFYLNRAYGYDLTTNPDKRKYKFSGWYVDDTYSTIYSKDMSFEWFAGSGDIVLYAKWADEEKGTEGLVFREVFDADGNVIGVAVADFMNRAEYEKSDINGCGYNNFVGGNEYSINMNDQGAVPSYLGTDIEVQIPAKHGGTNSNQLTVLGILRGALARHGQEIKTISLPNTLRFLEEEALVRCNLTDIYGVSGEDVTFDGQNAVYQKSAIEYYIGGERRTSAANTLIAFANRSQVTAYTVAENTVRIGGSAFYLSTVLTQITLSSSLVSVGKKAFAGSGIKGSITLPDSLARVETEAFLNCEGINEIAVTASSSLSKVGKNAFSSTGWYMKKTGFVTLNGILLGLRKADGTTFDKDSDGNYVVTVIDGEEAYSHTDGNGVAYYSKALGTLVAISIKSNVKAIGDNAFEGSIGTISVTIEGTLAGGIGSQAFFGCSIKRVDFDNLGADCVVEKDAFYRCNPFNVYVVDETAVNESWLNCTNVTVVKK